MRKNRSPWIHQLNKERAPQSLASDISVDVAIVGAGIAGIASAFFALKYTKESVILLEGFKLAHGATGHNAGQVATYFEKGFANMVEDFGMERAADAQTSINGAWELLNEMYRDAGLDIFFSQELGHDGYSTYEQTLRVLEEAWLKREAGLEPDHMAISVTAPFLDDIPQKYAGLYRAVPHATVLEMLETKNPVFLAVSSVKKGSINSALFCERIAAYLTKTYPERFALYEHTPVHKVILHADSATLDAHKYTVKAKRVVLCTNGFENFHIINENGLEVDAKFHHNVRGRVAYMSAYLESADNPPIATSYETPEEPTEYIPYYYLTRRPYEFEEGVEHNLVSIGGPEEPFENDAYSRESEYPERAIEVLNRFVREIYAPEKAEGRVKYEIGRAHV
jgi:glycine/D-amino acid oxidase-like deaminating enzyme